MLHFDISIAEQVVSSAKSNMDPRLQILIAGMRSGKVKAATTSTAENEVAVIARVADAESWLGLSEVRDATIIGPSADKHFIVTGRIPVPRIEKVRDKDFVKSLKAAQPLKPNLAKVTEETGAQPAQLPPNNLSNGGSGTVVGIIDYDGDFVHKNFRKANGNTRLLALWDQNGGNSPASPFGYGIEHSEDSINLAIKQADPYSILGYFPEDNAHGTHVMDIAAGNGNGSRVPGLAPNADLIFVNVTHDKDPVKPSEITRTSFGDSVTLLEAIKYIFDKSSGRPTVVNISLGTNGGPHDGTTLVEQGIDALVSAAPNRAVVVAASNSYDDGIHTSGNLTAGGSYDLHWNVFPTNISQPIELELWYAGVDRLKVELYGPNGAILASVSPGETKQVMIGSRLVALVANRLDDPNNHDNMISVFLSSGMPGGNYRVRLSGITISNGQFHAWIERDNSFQSAFPSPNDNTHTIGSISCGKKVIAVGSYDANTPSKPISYFSSAGPTRDGRKKPEISAPGHNVWAAKSRSKIGVTQMSGTSMASPCVTGIIALMFAEAAKLGVNLTIDQTIQIITKTARHNPPSGNSLWDERYGYGRILAADAIQAVINLGTQNKISSKAPKLSKTAKRSNKL